MLLGSVWESVTRLCMNFNHGAIQKLCHLHFHSPVSHFVNFTLPAFPVFFNKSHKLWNKRKENFL